MLAARGSKCTCLVQLRMSTMPCGRPSEQSIRKMGCRAAYPPCHLATVPQGVGGGGGLPSLQGVGEGQGGGVTSSTDSYRLLDKFSLAPSFAHVSPYCRSTMGPFMEYSCPLSWSHAHSIPPNPLPSFLAHGLHHLHHNSTCRQATTSRVVGQCKGLHYKHIPCGAAWTCVEAITLDEDYHNKIRFLKHSVHQCTVLSVHGDRVSAIPCLG